MFVGAPTGADFRFCQLTEILQQAARDQFYAKGCFDMGGKEPIAHMAAQARGLGEAIGAICSIDSANLPANFGLVWIINAAYKPNIHARASFYQIETWRTIETEQIGFIKLDLRAVLIWNGV